MPDGDAPRDRIAAVSMQIAKALLESPDFIRLGLMLALERRPTEARARAMFLTVRDEAHRRISETMREVAPDLAESSVQLLTTYAMATADGLFIAKEIGGDSVDLIALFELHAHLVYDAAVRLSATEVTE